MTTAIVGVGNIGSAVARHLVAGGEPVVLAAKDESRAQALADELGPLAGAASVEDAISGADTVVLAVWLDSMRELIPAYAHLLKDKVVVDPSNPIGFDASGQMMRTLPDGESAGSVVAALTSRGRALRQGLRHAWRGRSRRERPPQPAGRAVLRHRRRCRRDNDRAADPSGRLRAVEGRRRGGRGPDRGTRRRPPPVRLQRRGRRHRPSPVRYCRLRRISATPTRGLKWPAGGGRQ